MEHHDGRDHEYCEQCGDCVLCDVPHECTMEKREHMAKSKLQEVKRQEITGEEQPSQEEMQIRALVQAQKEKTEREQRCNEALQKVLTEYNCDVGAFFNTGQSLILTTQLVTLPVVVKSVAK